MQSLTNPYPCRAPQSPVPHPRDTRPITRHSSLAKLPGRTILCGAISCAALSAADVRLAWNANSETNIAGYRVTYGTSAGSRPSTVNTGAVTTATVTGLTEGRTYYFAVQAVNQDGLVSSPSSEISHLVPTTPGLPPVTLIAQSGWTLRSVSSQETADEDGRAVNAFDGNPNTIWHSRFSTSSAPPPHEIQIDLGASRSIAGFRYLPRQDAFNHGNIGQYEFHISSDGVNWGSAVASGTFANNKAEKEVRFSSRSGRYVRLRALTDLNGGTVCTVAELNLIQGETTTPVNQAPLAAARTVTTNEDQAVAITLSATDADGDALNYSIVSQPTMGTLSGSGANRTYTPNPDANGTDSFTYRANDGSLNSNTATVTITITPVNDAPVAANRSVTTAEDQAVGIVLAATDTEASALSYSIVSQPTKGTLSGSGANRTYTPNPDANGTDSFSYRANDGSLNSNIATVSITISAVNDAPVAASQSLNTTEGRSLPITLTATDKEQPTLTYRIVTQPTKGTLSGSGANRTYTPNAGETGNDSFTFQANDGSANSAPATIRISVSAVNAAPVAANRSVTTTEDRALSITLSASDADGDALTYSIVTQPAKGTLSGSGADRSYTPNANAHGSDSFTYRANDGSLNSNTATVTITITPVNDAPVAAAASLSAQTGVPLPITLAASDKDGDSLSYRIVSEPGQGTLSGSGAALTYTPNADASGTDSFTYVANDGKADSNNGVVTITLSAAKPPKTGNRPPQFAAGALSFTVRQRQNFDVRIEATDADAGDALVYRKINGPAWLEVMANGRLVGTPPSGTRGSIRCRVRATDKAGAFAETVVEVKVGPAPLPLPWSLARFGALHAKSDAFSKSGSLTLKSSGTAAGREDSGVYAWQTLSDEGEITVRISALANASKDLRAGVMMRRSLAAHSKFAFLAVDGQGRIHWAQRAMPAAAVKGASRAGGKLPDVWLRLTRSAGKITAYTSRNGRDWTLVGSVWRRDVALSKSCYIGLWASSGSDDLCSVVFRNVKVTP